MNHNVNHLTLLRNKDFTIAREKKKQIKFRVPTLDAYIVDSNLTLLLNLMQINLEDFKNDNELAFVNHYDLLLYLCFNGELQDRLVDILEEYIVDVRIQTNGLFIDVDKIDEKEFNLIITTFRVALGLQSLDELEKASQTIEDEYEKKAREAEEKVKRIKKKGTKEQSPETGFEMDAVMLGVIKEFSFTMQQVLTMNIYTLLWFYQYVWKIGAYNIETIAYGNGLLKKHKHYLD
jgi:hypothetical protein